MRAQKLAIAGILALAAGLRGWLLARPLAALDGRALPDDAYLALEIAKSIGRGEGPRFVDYYTNGFQPLSVWITSIPFALVDPAGLADPVGLDQMVKWALGIGCAFDLGSLLLLAAVVRRGTGSAAAGLFAALVWALQPAVLRVAVNGLETSAAVFFLLLLWHLSLRRAEYSPRWLFQLGIVVGVAAMARIDLFFVGLALALVTTRAHWAARDPIGRWLQKCAALAAGALLGYTPWLVYSWIYTASFLPASGRAVRWISLTNADHELDATWFASMAGEGVAAIAANMPVLFPAALALAVIFALGSAWQKVGGEAKPEAGVPLSWLVLPALFSAALFVAYTGYIFAPWFFPRYLAPLGVLIVAVVAAGVAWLAPLAGRWRPFVWGVATIAAVAVCTVQLRFRELLFEPPDPWAGYRNLGLWARDQFEPTATIGSTQTGALAYYSNGFRVVNLDGVVNSRAYREVTAGRAIEYIRAERIDFIVGWWINLEYLKKNSRSFRDSDLRLAGYISEFRSWGIQWLFFEVHYPKGRAPASGS